MLSFFLFAVRPYKASEILNQVRKQKAEKQKKAVEYTPEQRAVLAEMFSNRLVDWEEKHVTQFADTFPRPVFPPEEADSAVGPAPRLK